MREKTWEEKGKDKGDGHFSLGGAAMTKGKRIRVRSGESRTGGRGGTEVREKLSPRRKRSSVGTEKKGKPPRERRKLSISRSVGSPNEEKANPIEGGKGGDV